MRKEKNLLSNSDDAQEEEEEVSALYCCVAHSNSTLCKVIEADVVVSHWYRVRHRHWLTVQPGD